MIHKYVTIIDQNYCIRFFYRRYIIHNILSLTYRFINPNHADNILVDSCMERALTICNDMFDKRDNYIKWLISYPLEYISKHFKIYIF